MHRRLVISDRRFGTYLPHLQVSSYGLTLEDGIETLSRNVRNKPPIYVACNPRRAKISFTPRLKPEISHNPYRVTLFMEGMNILILQN